MILLLMHRSLYQKLRMQKVFVSNRSEAKWEVRSGKLSGLAAAMEGNIERKVMVFVAQVLIDLVAHGASRTGGRRRTLLES